MFIVGRKRKGSIHDIDNDNKKTDMSEFLSVRSTKKSTDKTKKFLSVDFFII